MDKSRSLANYLASFKKNSDNETHFLDSTTVKVHQNACGAIGKNTRAQAIGKTAIGWSTKIHVVADSLGLPIHFFITTGQRHDSVFAKELLVKSSFQNGIMDGAYDSKILREFITNVQSTAVIPFRKRSLYPEAFDKELYKSRYLIECLFCHMKNYRRIATRYDKLASTYQTMIVLSFILIWFRF